jgi:hypothetical protein
MSETGSAISTDSSELAEHLRRMRARFDEFRGRL